MRKNPDLTHESMVERRLEELKQTPARDPLKAASGRARFLREAAEYRQTIASGKAAGQRGRLFPVPLKRLAMTALMTFILTSALMMGAGATVAAAQDDLPYEPLYPIKLWSEDVTLSIYNDPQEQAALLMTMAETRVQEMAALDKMGIIPPEQVRQRLEEHLRQTLVLAADMDEAARDQLLLRLQDRLQQQDRVLEKLQTHANEQAVSAFTQTRQMLKERLHLVDEGLVDPQEFRKIIKTEYGQDKGANNDPNQKGKPGNGSNGQPSGNGNGNHTPGQPNSNGSNNGNGGANPKNNQNGNGPGTGNDSGGYGGNQ